MSSSGSVPKATNSRHRHIDQTHSGLSKHDRSSGPPISPKPAHNNRVKASVQPGPTVTTGICLGWQVVLSACLEALMQHYKSRIFDEVSRLL